MADSKNAKPLYKKEHEANGFNSAKKPAQNHHNAFAVCGNWGIFRSSSCGKFYYHNSANGASQWEKPRDWTIKPDIDELIALHGGGGGGGGVGGGGSSTSSQREHPTPSQRPSSSSFPRQQQSAPQSSSTSAKRPQNLIQSIRNGDSPHASQNHDQRSSSKQPPSSSNSSNNNDFSNSLDAPAKRRKHDINSPGGTPQSSGSGGSGNAPSTQNKALSQLSEVLIQQVRDRLDDIKGKLQNQSQPSSQSSSGSSLEKQLQNKTGHGLSPSSSDNVQSCRPSVNNTRSGSPFSKAVPMEESDSKTSSDSSTSQQQQQQTRFLAEEPLFSLCQRCDRAIASLDLSAAPPRPQLCDLLASASDEMALRLEKQARRLREETVSKYDIVAQTAVNIKGQRSIVRKIDIMSEINAKRIAVVQKQIEELVASRKELASQLRQPSHLAPFTMPPQTPIGLPPPPTLATTSHGHR